MELAIYTTNQLSHESYVHQEGKAEDSALKSGNRSTLSRQAEECDRDVIVVGASKRYEKQTLSFELCYREVWKQGKH